MRKMLSFAATVASLLCLAAFRSGTTALEGVEVRVADAGGGADTEGLWVEADRPASRVG